MVTDTSPHCSAAVLTHVGDVSVVVSADQQNVVIGVRVPVLTGQHADQVHTLLLPITAVDRIKTADGRQQR